MSANLLHSLFVSVVLDRSLQSSEDPHLESQMFVGAGQVFDGTFCVNLASFVLGLIEYASNIGMAAGLAWRSTSALPISSGTGYICILPDSLTLHFFLLHDSQAIDTRARFDVAGPATAAELTVDGRI